MEGGPLPSYAKEFWPPLEEARSLAARDRA